ncbi:unnamed protein product [Mortierella alpina]
MADTDLVSNKLAIYRQLIGQNVPLLEWRYEQRRNARDPPVHLSGALLLHAQSRRAQERRHHPHRLSLGLVGIQILKVHHPDQFRYLQLEISDAATQNLITLFPAVKRFMDQAILQENGKVLVNCMSGISRSPAFVVAYLMEATGLDYEMVYRYVQNKRFCMNPNPGFRHQLEEYGPIYTAIQSVGSQPTEQRSSVRRAAPEDDDDNAEEAERLAPRLRP